MDRYICVHGHFYQPSRENPWLESVELQDSAYPFHDWNERITAECYAMNGASRILNNQERIERIVNNYADISFNVGPTLLAWLESKAPETYRAILDADKESQAQYSGHGSAIAQAYNHMIMPLANERDRHTQAFWGVRDFQRRFGRDPEGMWLPETAVNTETLEVLADLGIAFTILSPSQAGRVRPLTGGEWLDVSGGNIDPTTAYRMRLPSGMSIALFFYDGPISQAVAFEQLLERGETFAQRIAGGFSNDRSWPQIVHIATDGESYGHHHRFGDMALAYALQHIQADGLAKLTNYGEYLEKHPPTFEVEIIENTAWSCSHGVERWRSDCGDNTGGHPGWNQTWRAPLREALDGLRDTLAPLYEKHAAELLKDPWAARDRYIDVVLDRSPESVQRFFDQHASRPLDQAGRTRALKLLELQRHAMLMYTSCGWFFDELSGIETTQVIQYAGRAVQLARELFGDNMEEGFLTLLAHAKSNIADHKDGRVIYEKFVRLAMVDLEKVTAHYAISSLFENYSDQAVINCFRVGREDARSFEAGRTRLLVGRAAVTNTITEESGTMSFAVLHLGDHNFSCGVREHRGPEAYDALLQELEEVFGTAEFPELVRVIDKHFGQSAYSLRSLFQDERRKVLDRVLEGTSSSIESSLRQSYEVHVALMRFLASLRVPLPRALLSLADLIVDTDLAAALSAEPLDVSRVQAVLEQANMWNIDLDKEGLGFRFGQTLMRMMRQLMEAPDDVEVLQQLNNAVQLAIALPFAVDFWAVQNPCYSMMQAIYPERLRKAEAGDQASAIWVEQFRSLATHLSVMAP